MTSHTLISISMVSNMSLPKSISGAYTLATQTMRALRSLVPHQEMISSLKQAHLDHKTSTRSYAWPFV